MVTGFLVVIFIWLIVIGVLYLIGSFLIDKIAQRQCWLESSKQLGNTILWIIIGVITGSLVFLSVLILINFVYFIIIYRRENEILFLIENPRCKKILLHLDELGFLGIGNISDCCNFKLKGDDYKILNSLIRNHKCRGFLNVKNGYVSPGKILRLEDGIEWKNDFCK